MSFGDAARDNRKSRVGPALFVMDGMPTYRRPGTPCGCNHRLTLTRSMGTKAGRKKVLRSL